MKIENIPIEKIKPYPQNPRLNAHAVDKVAQSIQQFGFRQPIVVDKNYTIIVGHTRWLAAKQLGLKTVPVHIAHELTEQQAKAYRVIDNQTAAFAQWDFDKLAEELKQIEKMAKPFFEDFFEKFEEKYQKEKFEKKVIELSPYFKTHFLISIEPKDFSKIEPILNQIKQTIPNAEILQSSN